MFPEMMPARVVLATENSLIGEGLAVSLQGVASVEVIGRARDPDELVRLVGETAPDAIIVTLRSAARTTTATQLGVRRLRSEFPAMGIVIIADRVDGFSLDLLLAGPSRIAYLLDDEVRSMATVLYALHQVCAGGTVLDPSVRSALDDRPVVTGIDHLTSTQVEVLDRIARGLSDAAIADELRLPVGSVGELVSSLFDTLGLVEQPAFDRRVAAALVYLRARSDPTGPDLFGGMSDEVRVHMRSLLDQQAVSAAAGGGPTRSDGETERDWSPQAPSTEVALLNTDGVIVAVNAAWESFGAANGGDPTRSGVGRSYLEVCRGADDNAAKEVEGALRVALRGDLPAPVRVLIPCDSPDSERWFDVLISSRLNDDGRCLGATVTLSLVV